MHCLDAFLSGSYAFWLVQLVIDSPAAMFTINAVPLVSGPLCEDHLTSKLGARSNIES